MDILPRHLGLITINMLSMLSMLSIIRLQGDRPRSVLCPQRDLIVVPLEHVMNAACANEGAMPHSHVGRVVSQASVSLAICSLGFCSVFDSDSCMSSAKLSNTMFHA